MIHVLLTSELPQQHNDVISFFTWLCFSQYRELMRSGNAVSSHSGLIPSETLYEKKRKIALADHKKIFLMSVHTAAFFTIFACNLVYEYKFHGLIKNRSVNFFKNLMISRLITLMYVSSKFQPH